MQPLSDRTKRPRQYDSPDSDYESPSRSRRARVSADEAAQCVRPKLQYADYTVLWICALSLERAAAEAVLDQEHEILPSHELDYNVYTLGRIAEHNIVIACLPEGAYGPTRATQVLTDALRTFPQLRNGYGLMVGIGGGVPGPNNDIRLGDVVVGTKVTPYGPSKVTKEGRMMTDESVKPHRAWLQALTAVSSKHERTMNGMPTQMAMIMESCFKNIPDYNHPEEPDNLFPADYNHASSGFPDCRHCDFSLACAREPRQSPKPKVHYGTIASGHDLIKVATERERLRAELDVLCFEMEAAGLMNTMQCLPIRGIADYADSHKNERWQRYAAANAAAFAKEVLGTMRSGSSQTHTDCVVNGLQQTANEISRQPVSADLRKSKLESLKFKGLGVRKDNVKSSYRKTCRWLSEQTEYLEWLSTPCNSRHGGFLWIKGNPGTGKSTLMKFAFQQEAKKAEKHRRQSGTNELVVSYFFHARGNEMEKSVEGMYRALILQILQGFTDLQHVLDEIDATTITSEGISLNQLVDLFQAIVSNLGSRRITCFIDALDEGGRKQVVEMVKRFQEVLEDYSQPGSQLRICFSSRHYPFIKPRVGLQMVLEKLPGHSRDLEEYILGNLDIDDPEDKTSITMALLEKAKGIFLWTALVVDYLNEDISRGLPFKERFTIRLEQVPEGLSDLFKHLLSHHPADMETFRLMVAWLLFSKEQLSPRQIDHALWSGSHGNELRNSTPPSFDDINPEGRVRKRVIDASKGLAEILASDPPVVQFIHESVRDFLLKDRGLARLWPGEFIGDAVHHCHDLLKNCCDQYLNYPLMAGAIYGGLHFVKREERQQAREIALARYPMLDYACQYILHHADAAAPSVPQNVFLSGISLPYLATTLNFFEDFKTRFYSTDVDLLCVLTTRGHAELIRDWSGGDISTHSFDLVVKAIEGQHEKVFAALVEKILPGLGVAECWRKFQFRDPIRRCAGRTLLTLAAQEGCDELLERLLIEGAVVDGCDANGKDAMYRACSRDQLSTVQLLVSYGNGIWTAESLALGGDAYLQVCLDKGSDRCAAWLIENGAGTFHCFQLRRGLYDRADRVAALYIASRKGMKSSVEALLQREGLRCDVPIPYEGSRSLHAAAKCSRLESGLEIMECLLRYGANVSDVDRHGQTPLLTVCSHWRGSGSNLQMAKFLVEAGADVNARDHQGQTPLMFACQLSDVDVVELLQGAGANHDAVDKRGHSAFWYATMLISDLIILRALAKRGRPSPSDGDHVWRKFRDLDVSKDSSEAS